MTPNRAENESAAFGDIDTANETCQTYFQEHFYRGGEKDLHKVTRL